MTDTIQKIADEMTDRASKLRREAGDGDHLLQVIGREVAETVNGWAGRLRALSARASAGEGGELMRGLTRAVELLRQIHDEHSAPDGVGVHWGTWEALSNYIAEADDNGVAYLNAIDEGPDGEDGPWAEGWGGRSRPVADPFTAPQPAQAGAGGGGDSETIDCVRGQYGCGGPYSKTECLGCSQWRAANPKHDEPVGTVHLYPATNGYAESLGVSWNNQWNQIPPIGTKLYTTTASPATGQVAAGCAHVWVPGQAGMMYCDQCGRQKPAAAPQPAAAQGGVTLTPEELEWIEYAIDHMLDDNEPEDQVCARVLRGLLDRTGYVTLAAAPQPQEAPAQEWKQPVICSCHTERQRELCMKRKECVVAYATGNQIATPPAHGDGEGDAFEAWAASQKYDMTKHPLHWLFLNERTYAARQGWKAGMEYALTTRPTPEAQEDECEAAIERAISGAMIDNGKRPSDYKDGIVKGLEDALRLVRKYRHIPSAHGDDGFRCVGRVGSSGVLVSADLYGFLGRKEVSHEVHKMKREAGTTSGRGDVARNDAFNLADTVIERIECGDKQGGRDAIREEFERLTARLNLVAREAARYRWLRDQNANLDNPDAWTITRCDFTDKEMPSRYWVGSDLDAAIDAALALPAQGEGSNG